MRLRLAVLLALAAAAGPAVGGSSRTKTEERRAFHPRAVGMPGATRLAGYARRLEMERTTPFGAIRFRRAGPEIQGGRIVAIAFPRARPDTILVAFASGGLWRTENRGGSWESLFDRESSMTIGDLALGDDEGRVLWVGTGENNSSRSSYAGTGVFKSTDAGKTWTNAGLPDSHHVGRIVVDPTRPDTVWVASLGPLYTEGGERGVYKTTDGGRTWRRTLFVDARTGIVDLAADPSDANVLYAAAWERDRKAWNFLESGPGSGIFKSRDGGETWSRLSGGFPSGDGVGRIGLAISPARPTTVYAVLDNQARRPETEAADEDAPSGELTPRRLRTLTDGQAAELPPDVLQRFLDRNDFPKDLKAKALLKDLKGGKVKVADLVAYLSDANRDLFETDVVGAEVWRSDDAGATWARTHEKRLDQVFFSYGYYFARIAVAPDDADRVWIVGVPLLRSTDGGKTFEGLDRHGVHVDHHAVAFDPERSRRIALGNDGGLNLSWDGGATWTKVNNLPVGQFTTIAVDDATPYNVLGGLQDNGTMRGPSDYVPGKSDPGAWKSIGGGDGSCVQVDPKDRNVVYTASQFGYATRQNLKTGERARIRPRPALKEKPLRYNWVTPFLISPHAREVLYYGTNRLFRSFDRGETWTAISGDLTSNREPGDVPFGTITTIAESPKKFGVIWVGTDEGRVWGTRDGGATWKDLGAGKGGKGIAADRWVTRVVASAHEEGTVYVSQNGYRDDDFAPYVFRSTDYGESWTSLARGLPDEPVNTIREDPKARNVVFVGTDLGAFVSLDRGDTWEALTGGLPHVPVHDLAIHPKEGDVVLGTHGQSVWIADVSPLRALSPEVRKKDLHAFPAKGAEWERRRGYGIHPFVAHWRPIPTERRLAWWAGPSTKGETRITVRDGWGNVWAERTADTRPGLNVFVYDLTADPKRADAAEIERRRREGERAEAREDLRKRFAPKPPEGGPAEKEGAASAAEEGDEEGDEAVEKPLRADVLALLADPLIERRARYLPPGTYSIEIAVGDRAVRTKLTVKAPKGKGEEDDDGPEPDR